MAGEGAWIRFENQVAGHDDLLRLSTDDLIVIKPCTEKELVFYQDAQRFPEFLEWIPECYGTLRAATEEEKNMITQQPLGSERLNESGGVMSLPAVDSMSRRVMDSEGRQLDQHICLENLTQSYTRPCILDLKVGFRLHEKDASASKQQKMILNAKGTTSESLGARISGMKVFNSEKRTYGLYRKPFREMPTNESLVEGLLAFFFPTSIYGEKEYTSRFSIPMPDDDKDRPCSRQKISGKKVRWILQSFIDDVHDMRQFIAEHPELELTSASLLFLYEGDQAAADKVWATMLEEDAAVKEQHTAGHTNGDTEANNENEDDGDNVLPSRLCDVRLIDFSHSSWNADQSEQDTDLLRSLDNVLDLLQHCLTRQRAEQL